MPRPAIVKWCQQFEDGRIDLTDEERQGSPTTVRTSDMVQQVEDIILSSRRVSVADISQELGISVGSAHSGGLQPDSPSPGFATGSAHSIVRHQLDFRKLCSQWVPYSLTSEYKGARFAASLEFLQRYSEEDNDFLSRIITGDETWVHCFTPETKQASMARRHTSSTVRTKSKVPPSAGKVWLLFLSITKELSTPSLCGRAQPLMLSRTAKH
ncbi:hypothetical protein AVEN_98399-1 [Araneus ventricosus]|uniref:Histone-lysine N-methyltransferase SETMAR n=1 Tax=Araneus ventricosus TaxID=182803 RepID=A0A4Y1ZUU5_ARAVE|nr:hypothetical protein AVEN_98399-1 [Araneus ventricosus]